MKVLFILLFFLCEKDKPTNFTNCHFRFIDTFRCTWGGRWFAWSKVGVVQKILRRLGKDLWFQYKIAPQNKKFVKERIIKYWLKSHKNDHFTTCHLGFIDAFRRRKMICLIKSRGCSKFFNYICDFNIKSRLRIVSQKTRNKNFVKHDQHPHRLEVLE